MLKPKRFAGIFAAAPSIALASLGVNLVTKGAAPAAQQSLGMTAGGVGMVVYCMAAAGVLRRVRGVAGSVTCLAAWFAVALSLYFLFLR